MKLNVVTMPATKMPLRKSPGFAKKGLADFALDILGLCEYGCRYCSSNAGNYLRINREPFADQTQQQLGERLYPAEDPTLTFHWDDVEDRLSSILEKRNKSWGAGKTLVFSMLTDGFSPTLVASGVTERVLLQILAKTSFRIRILTKNACVGLSKIWLDFFAKHADRFVVGLSTGTLNDDWSRRVEINTPAPSQRIKALHRLQDAGVPTYGMLCPIFPDALIDDGVERLVQACRPEKCETVWAEPYNDRANWRHVRDGYPAGSQGYVTITDLFENPGAERTAWSCYATDLALELREIATRDQWISRLVYLLYEDGIIRRDAHRLMNLEGISLQSAPEYGLSANPYIKEIQMLNPMFTEKI